MTINFTGRHFPSEIIYYLAYKLSYREIEEILAEHDIIVDHSTLNRWVIKYAPLLEHQARQIRSLLLLRGGWTRPGRTHLISSYGSARRYRLFMAIWLWFSYGQYRLLRGKAGNHVAQLDHSILCLCQSVFEALIARVTRRTVILYHSRRFRGVEFGEGLFAIGIYESLLVDTADSL